MYNYLAVIKGKVLNIGKIKSLRILTLNSLKSNIIRQSY